MEATQLSLAKSLLDSLLGVAKSLLADELALQMGVKHDLSFIRDEFATIQAALKAADGRRSRRPLDLAWVAQVRDLAYDAEDSLQGFSVELASKPSSCCSVGARHRVGTMLKNLKARVVEVSQRRLRYLVGDEAITPELPVAAGGTLAAAVWGRGEEESQPKAVDLVKLLMDSTVAGLKVIALCGADDDGARAAPTIVREAYADPRVRTAFGCRAWVTLPHPLDRENFLRSALRQFYTNPLEDQDEARRKRDDEESAPAPEIKLDEVILGENDVQVEALDQNPEVDICYWTSLEITEGGSQAARINGLSIDKRMAGMNDCQVPEEFARHVNESRYLIVLNNVSAVDDWDCIRTCLPGSQMNDGWVIVTTRHVETARMCVGQLSLQGHLHWSPLPYGDEPIYLFFGEGLHQAVSNAAISSVSKIEEDRSEHTIAHSLLSADNRKKRVKIAADNATMEESQFMWRDDEKNLLQNMIFEATSNLDVISVWGIGGVGKTVLVRSIYLQVISEKEPNNTNVFHNRAWVTMQHPFDISEFFRNLVLQLRPAYVQRGEYLKEKLATMELESLTDQVSDLLQGKRSLIVLDDLSSITEWKLISRYIPREEKCTIVLTTREQAIAEHCSRKIRKKEKILNLESLTEKHALELFMKKVFNDTIEATNDVFPDSGMKEQANLILNKCHGLPLLITTIGGFLATKPKNANEWKKLNDHLDAELHTNHSLVAVKTVLSSVYDGLPYYLKPCFMYLSLFPKGHRIRQKRLVKRWTAEGYSQGIYEKTATENGQDYFMELMSRSMIEPSKITSGARNSRARSDFYRVHNLVRQIGMSKSEEENLVFILDNECSLDPDRKIRHIAISSNWTRDKNFMERAADFSCTRSMTVFGEWQSFFISKKMKLLRVLDLEDTRDLHDRDLEPIGNLHHLKYLSLRGSRGVSELPSSFGNLCSLETLDIRDTYVTKLPGCIVNLQKLKYIRAGRIASNDGLSTMKTRDIPKELAKHLTQTYGIGNAAKRLTSDKEVDEMEEVEHYPSFFFRLGVLLKSRNVHGVHVPEGMRKLQDLHTIGVINVYGSRGKPTILKELKKLPQLHKLGMTGITKEISNEVCSAISHLSRLESLSLRSEGKPGLEGSLDAISKPPRYLQSLKLYGNLCELPQWINRLYYLVKLNLRSTRLNYDAIPILGQLPSLTVLRLWSKSIKGGALHFRKNFGSLVVLELADLYDLVFLKFTEGAAPKLEQLVVRDCWSIDKIGISGLSSLKNLKQVSIKGAYYRRFKQDLEQQLGDDRKHVLKVEDFIQPKGSAAAKKYLKGRDERQ